MWTIAFVTAAFEVAGCGSEDQPPPQSSGVETRSTTSLTTVETTASGGGGGQDASCEDPTLLPEVTDAVAWENALANYSLEGPVLWCLGENDHGVAQSSRVYLHLLRKLIVEHGVRHIGWEGSGANIDHFDRYLQTGDEAEIDQAFAEIPGSIGVNTERREWLKSLRALGEAEGIRLHAWGFDVAGQLPPNVDSLREFLDDAQFVSAEREACLDIAPEDPEVAGGACDRLAAELEAAQSALESMLGSDRVWRGLRDARNLAVGHRFLWFRNVVGDLSAGYAVREPAMLQNIIRIRERIGVEEPLVLTAHNGHCGRGRRQGRDPETLEPLFSFGTGLAERLGNSYQPIGQFYLGGTRINPRNGTPDPYPDTSGGLEAAIGELASTPALVVPTSSCVMDFQSSYRNAVNERITPAESFDHIVWLESVTPVTLE
ncbi:MAG: erythromycin esterase family protein [Myxococcota bacterium]